MNRQHVAVNTALKVINQDHPRKNQAGICAKATGEMNGAPETQDEQVLVTFDLPDGASVKDRTDLVDQTDLQKL